MDTEQSNLSLKVAVEPKVGRALHELSEVKRRELAAVVNAIREHEGASEPDRQKAEQGVILQAYRDALAKRAAKARKQAEAASKRKVKAGRKAERQRRQKGRRGAR